MQRDRTFVKRSAKDPHGCPLRVSYGPVESRMQPNGFVFGRRSRWSGSDAFSIKQREGLFQVLPKPRIEYLASPHRNVDRPEELTVFVEYFDGIRAFVADKRIVGRGYPSQITEEPVAQRIDPNASRTRLIVNRSMIGRTCQYAVGNSIGLVCK